MSIVIQHRERRITMNLPNGERTTASDVVNELSRGELSQEMQDCIPSIVPFGGVVHCAILNNNNETGPDIEEGSLSDREHDAPVRGPAAHTRRRRADRADVSDFVWGFTLGYLVGPIMCFWLLESAPKLQKVGIFLGCCLRMFTGEYHYLLEMNSEKEVLSTAPAAVEVPAAEKSSFEIVTSVDSTVPV